MRKTFKYRIFPSHKQTTALEKTLNSCRWLYNYLLEQRKVAWESENKNFSYYEQCKGITHLKIGHIFLIGVHSQVLQNVAARIDLAFKSFFRRIKTGGKPGYPRFRGKFRYDSFTYPQDGFKILKNVIQLSKIGGVKIKLHRPVEGAIKTCTVRRTPTGKWFVALSCDVNCTPAKQAFGPIVGIDMGLEHFATLSNGKHIKNPRFFRSEEKVLAKAQRKLSAQKKASAARAEARKVVARIHERTSNKRQNFSHQLSRKLVGEYNTICVEDLSINDIQKDNFRCVNRSISDAAWRMFLNQLSYKAEYAGQKLVQINPAYTSQTCSRCGARQKLKLSDRVFNCHCCELSLNRDINAAKNILSIGLGTQSLASA